MATTGQAVVSVTSGVVDKIGYPYGDDLSYRYIRLKTQDGYIVRSLYIAPIPGIEVGSHVAAGQSMGLYQGLGTRYPGITEHVHVDIQRNGQFIDPATLIPNITGMDR